MPRLGARVFQLGSKMGMERGTSMNGKQDEIKSCLDQLLPRGECVLSFDDSLVDQLPDILRELHEIRSMSDLGRVPALETLLGLLGQERASEDVLPSLPKLIEQAGIDKTAYVPKPPTAVLAETENMFSRWSVSTVKDDRNAVLALQRDLGRGEYNPSSEGHGDRWERGTSVLRHYLRGVTTVPPSFLERLTRTSYWELWIRWWKIRGWLDANLPSLSIGPRWITEIEFFRAVLGLKGHIGLDLFSSDESLIKVGDMHHMPFPDRYFQLVFIKNTVDKSYHVRRLVAELIRVTRPGGIVIIDQICGYGDCSPLTRTDIQKSENLLRLFRDKSSVRVLVQSDIDLLKRKGAVTRIRDRSRNNARLALQMPS